MRILAAILLMLLVSCVSEKKEDRTTDRKMLHLSSVKLQISTRGSIRLTAEFQ